MDERGGGRGSLQGRRVKSDAKKCAQRCEEMRTTCVPGPWASCTGCLPRAHCMAARSNFKQEGSRQFGNEPHQNTLTMYGGNAPRRSCASTRRKYIDKWSPQLMPRSTPNRRASRPCVRGRMLLNRSGILNVWVKTPWVKAGPAPKGPVPYNVTVEPKI
jgi:hypothetical protein